MQERLVLPSGLNVLLRPPRPEDAWKVYEAVDASQAELYPWMPWCHEGYCEKDTEDWIELSLQLTAPRSEFPFVIWDDDEENCLGTCSINHINYVQRTANLGYWVRSSHCGLGIAPVVARAVAQYGFQELQFVRLEIVVAIGNSRSQRVAEKVGAVREGIARNGLLNGNMPIDAIQNSLVPEDLA